MSNLDQTHRLAAIGARASLVGIGIVFVLILIGISQ